MKLADRNFGSYIGYADNTDNGVSGLYSIQNIATLKSNNMWHSKIISNGLIFHLDAGKPTSYPGTGNIIYDIAPRDNIITDSLTMPPSTWGARENVTITTGQLDPFNLYNAVKVHPNTTTDNYFGNRLNILENTAYTISVWLKATGSFTLPIIAGTNGTGTCIRYNALLTTNWQLFTFSGVITAEPTHLFHIGGWATWTSNAYDVFIAYPSIIKTNGYNASFINSPVYSSIYGGIINFTSSNSQYLQVNSGFSSFTSGLTIEFFAKFPATANNWERLMDFGTGQALNNILLARNGTSTTLDAQFIVSGSGVGVVDVANGVLNDTWAHYTYIVNGTNAILYRNGIQIGAVATTSFPSKITRTLNYIGKSNWQDAYFGGSIGIARIYNRPLTITEIQQNFNALRGRYNI